MANRLADAVSPYLRAHAQNPVDWWPWGSEAFAEAERRQVPVVISIGYATCHWCHVMARESFSDPAVAEYQNEHFVSIKVDREEHPDVDASYLAAASAFTEQLGWPLTVFATPLGRAFYAGTYFPPVAMSGLPSFREVLEAMVDAWRDQRESVEDAAGRLAAAIAAPREAVRGALPGNPEFDAVIDELLGFEDRQFGGFGGAPKFPVVPLLGFLQDRAAADPRADADPRAAGLVQRTLDAMERSPLRDPVDGGFFRYGTRRDWSEPHYERMLYDNAQLLAVYARGTSTTNLDTADGIASFLLTTLRLPSGGFASAQDSESTIDGVRVEGDYYRLGEDARRGVAPPPLDDKVLTGWNGLAIGALAAAGARLQHPEWIAAAIRAAEFVAGLLVGPGVGPVFEPGVERDSNHLALVRARIGERTSSAKPTLEDYGMLAEGLLDLAIATGEVRFATRARELVASTLSDGGFTVPGGGDDVLATRGLLLDNDPSEGAYPSGLSALSRAAIRLDQLGARSEGTGSEAAPGFREHAIAVLERIAPLALARPISFGSALGAMSLLARPVRQLVVVTEDATRRQSGPMSAIARTWSDGLGVVVTSRQAEAFAAAGFGLFEGRVRQAGFDTAYLCENFVCRLPVTDAGRLGALLTAS